MASVGMNDLRVGVKIMVEGDPCTVIESDLVKPGKGQAFTRIRYRNLKTGRVLERTYKSGDTAELADVVDTDLQFLYADGAHFYFMHPDSYEQVVADASAVGDAAQWLRAQDLCTVTLWNGQPIAVTPPNFVTLRVTRTDPGVRGDTASGGSKPATLETGAVVKVPLFLEEGEVIKVDTRVGQYVSRVKE
jgi:elongation factor P